MIELKPCTKCGRRPLLGYACGEYFILGQVGGCEVCDNFVEMHATREQEAEAWNRRAACAGRENAESDIHAMRNELCQYCGKYKHAHEGACDGCKWR